MSWTVIIYNHLFVIDLTKNTLKMQELPNDIS